MSRAEISWSRPLRFHSLIFTSQWSQAGCRDRQWASALAIMDGASGSILALRTSSHSPALFTRSLPEFAPAIGFFSSSVQTPSPEDLHEGAYSSVWSYFAYSTRLPSTALLWLASYPYTLDVCSYHQRERCNCKCAVSVSGFHLELLACLGSRG
jgi:hypothetical protein